MRRPTRAKKALKMRQHDRRVHDLRMELAQERQVHGGLRSMVGILAAEHRRTRAGPSASFRCYIGTMSPRPPALVLISRALIVLAIESALLAWGLGGFHALVSSPRAWALIAIWGVAGRHAQPQRARHAGRTSCARRRIHSRCSRWR
jgi:hypothetical protein